MGASLDKQLERWVSAGVLDAGTAERIRALEQAQLPSERLRWPVLLALALGGVLMCAGILLFVAAHWDELSPGWRFSLVLLLVTAFPVAGVFRAVPGAGYHVLRHWHGLCRRWHFPLGADF